MEFIKLHDLGNYRLKSPNVPRIHDKQVNGYIH